MQFPIREGVNLAFRPHPGRDSTDSMSLRHELPSRASHLGCELAYWARGDGPPVFFIQGTGLHGNGWLPQVEPLSEDHACVWFDNRGLGLSQPPGSVGITVEQMAGDALAVLGRGGLHIAGVERRSPRPRANERSGRAR